MDDIKHMKKLSSILRLQLLEGANRAGYDIDEILMNIDETEVKVARAFLVWVIDNGKTFWHGNIDSVFTEFSNHEAY